MITVCWKWTGSTSESDRAALEVALTLMTAGEPVDLVTVVTLGPPAAEPALREALAAGASRAVRIDAPGELHSETVARALAGIAMGSDWVVCGDASADRGSGAVPAFIAAALGIGQALGLVGVERADHASLLVERRLDGGRREVLHARAPTVLSVEGSAARLRRASLPAELAAQRAPIEIRDGPSGPVESIELLRPYRPRARAHHAPAGDATGRIWELTGASGTSGASHTEVVGLDPVAAAARILDQLGAWGYR